MSVTFNNIAKSKLTQIPNEIWLIAEEKKPALEEVKVQQSLRSCKTEQALGSAHYLYCNNALQGHGRS